MMRLSTFRGFFGCFFSLVTVTWLAAAGTGCAAVYPEIKTPLKPVPAGRQLEPPPPTDVLYIAIAEVEIPSRTRDGRSWDDSEGGKPDPYAKIYLNGQELFVTPTQSDTLRPTWPEAPKRNYDVPEGSVLLVELWDDNPLHSRPICAKEFKNLHEAAVEYGELKALCGGGTRIRLELKPAEAKFGLGFHYELRSQQVFITQVLPLSPAARAGLAAGDQILEVMGRPVKRMSSAELRSAVNSNAPQGLELLVRSGSEEETVQVKEGPIYLKGES